MKKIAKYSLIAFIATTFATSCTPDELMSWQGGGDIYFTHFLMPGSHMRAQDTVDLRFFFMPEDTDSILVPLSVTTSGLLTNYDREISVSLSSFFRIDGVMIETELVEGEHFRVERSYIRARRVEDTLNVWIFRTADLEEEGRMGFLGLTLVENQHFNTELRTYRDNPSVAPHSVLTRWIRISNAIVRPQFWDDGFFGTYSAEKFRVIGLANPTMPLAFLDGAYWNNDNLAEMSVAERQPWFLIIGHTTQHWLNEWHSDPNNPEFTEINAEGVEVRMSMGPRVTGN